jgi:peptidoglycan-N-acetylglucosamine deacetylase
VLGLAIATATAAAAAIAAGYQSVAPTGQWFGSAFHGVKAGSKQIALTFDDGPNDPHTLNLLELLAKHNIPATFFLIGEYARKRPDIVTAIARQGHVIGNHTFTHPLLTFLPAAQIREEIMRCRDAINNAIGEHSNLFRPPWGSRRPGVFALVRRLGFEPIMWNISGKDWKSPSVEFIEREVTKKIRGGDVVLLHDGRHGAFGSDRSKTVAAVERLISRYQCEGYEFVTVPEMMRTEAA